MQSDCRLYTPQTWLKAPTANLPQGSIGHTDSCLETFNLESTLCTALADTARAGKNVSMKHFLHGLILQGTGVTTAKHRPLYQALTTLSYTVKSLAHGNH